MSSLDRLWAGWRHAYITSASDEGGPGASSTGTDPGGPDGAQRCVFCRILASEAPDAETHVVWRHPDGEVVALLNAYPYASGHLMVMPARHVADLDALGPAESATLWQGVIDATRALQAAYGPDGLNVGANLGHAAGAGVPGHLHIHVLPRWVGDTNFMTSVANTRVLPEALSVSDEKLRGAWPG
ncbi:MAG: HIT domain-containing protein [Actinomycetota bacterium]|nr:HIT domain-containing protein [Actinomycetota bacterium]